MEQVLVEFQGDQLREIAYFRRNRARQSVLLQIDFCHLRFRAIAGNALPSLTGRIRLQPAGTPRPIIAIGIRL